MQRQAIVIAAYRKEAPFRIGMGLLFLFVR
jgi:hypothetical protein